MAVCYNARQDNVIQNNTITHITQHSRQPSIRKITKQNPEHILYTIKTQKRVEPEVDGAVLRTTRYTKQSVHRTALHYNTIQHSVTHISPRPTPHSTSLTLRTLHIPHRLNSLPFTSLINFQPPFLEILDFFHTLKSLHCTSLNRFLTFSLYILDFPAIHNPFTSLHISQFSPFSWKYSIFSSLQIPFTSIHFSSLITFLTLFLKVLGLKGKVPKAFTGSSFQN